MSRRIFDGLIGGTIALLVTALALWATPLSIQLTPDETDRTAQTERAEDQPALYMSFALTESTAPNLMEQIPRFFEEHNFSNSEVMLFTAALMTAEPCTGDEATECGMLMETRKDGSSRTVPFVASAGIPNDLYKIVPAEAQYVQTAGDYYTPRLVVYHFGPDGKVTRVDETGQVSQRWFGAYEYGWHQIDNGETAH